MAARKQALLYAALFCLGLATPAEAGPPCSDRQPFEAVDFSRPLTELDGPDGESPFTALHRLGVRTVFRYYDHREESLGCKTLLPAESDAILAAGLSIAVVFQHNADDPETFIDPTRGRRDAERSLELAAANGQPSGSAIYFGVDGADQILEDMGYEYRRSNGAPMSRARRKAQSGNPKHIAHYQRFLQYHHHVFARRAPGEIKAADILPFVERYFRDIGKTFARAAHHRPYAPSYRIGAYGSGMVCDFLLSRKLVSFCWLSQSKGWPQAAEFSASRRWTLKQEMPTDCPRWTSKRAPNDMVQFDYDRVSPAARDFGQWSKKRAGAALQIARPATCPAL